VDFLGKYKRYVFVNKNGGNKMLKSNVVKTECECKIMSNGGGMTKTHVQVSR
jgi:hypothetical protein